MNPCRHREQIESYLLGELAEDELAAFEQHLSTCSTCSEARASLIETMDALVSVVPAVEPPSHLRGDLMNRIRNASDAEVVAPPGLQTIAEEDVEWEPSRVPGVEMRRLHVDLDRGTTTFLVRMQAGYAYPAHRHKGAEQFYLLSGDLHSDELSLKPGDFQVAAPGSTHPRQWTEGGCMLLVIGSLEDYPLEVA